MLLFGGFAAMVDEVVAELRALPDVHYKKKGLGA